MHRPNSANQFRHIVFPREESRQQVVNLAPREIACTVSSEPEQDLPKDDAAFLCWLFEQAGLDVRHYRSETLHRRLPACLRTLRANSPAHARQLLAESAALVETALNTMLVGVTSFYRDPHVFEQIRREILPELVTSRKGIYAWSIGCSEGAELYSLAMLLAEAGILGDCYLLGTDCRAEAIEQAREGYYDESLARNVPQEFCGRYLERRDGRWHVCEAIRHGLRWRVVDLLGDLGLGLWDVILFRNTGLYLRPEVVEPLWPQLERALRPGGILVLGRAERPAGTRYLRAAGPCIYRRAQK